MSTVDRLPSVQASTGDVNVPTSNTAAVVTYAADPDKAHVVHGLTAGYDGAPAATGTLKVEDGSGNTVWITPITAGGTTGPMEVKPGIRGTKGRAMIITLSAGGSGVTGYLSVSHATEG